MAPKETNGEMTYRCEQYDRHLCYRVAQGYYLASDGDCRAPTTYLRYRCTHCGRKARRRGSLCRPAIL
jgi:hypothetical protein